MHERFSRALEIYHDLAKAKLEVESPKTFEKNEELSDIEAAIRFHEKNLAGNREQEVKIQRRIFGLQQEKAKIMEELNRGLEALDDPDHVAEIEKGAYVVTTDGKGRLFSKGKEITEGMLLTDGEWGVKYHLDSMIPQSIREIYLIEEAKRRLRHLLDKQILEDQLGSGRTHDKKKLAYGAFKEMEGREEEVGGWIAERLVKSLFKRLTIDFDLDIDVIQTDLYEDVEHKIDFVIRRKKRARGVDIEAREEHQDLGIQLTTRKDAFALNHKRQQIERVRGRREEEGLRVEDIVLVSLPLGSVRSLYEQWSKKKMPGGLVELLPLSDREKIFKETLRGVIPSAEIEAQWRIVSSGYDRAA